jgi:hypothetical protein
MGNGKSFSRTKNKGDKNMLYKFDGGYEAEIAEGGKFNPQFIAAFETQGYLSVDDLKAVIATARPARGPEWQAARYESITHYTAKHMGWKLDGDRFVAATVDVDAAEVNA